MPQHAASIRAATSSDHDAGARLTSGITPMPAGQQQRFSLDDVQAAINEGMLGWLERFAERAAGAPAPPGSAAGVLVVAERIAPTVRSVCTDWHLSVRTTDGQDGLRVLTVTGPELPVQALSATLARLRQFAVTAR